MNKKLPPIIEKLKIHAKVRDGIKKIYKPHTCHTWEDCYSFDGFFHKLIYEHSPNEKSCHSIAVDVHGVVLDENYKVEE